MSALVHHVVRDDGAVQVFPRELLASILAGHGGQITIPAGMSPLCAFAFFVSARISLNGALLTDPSGAMADEPMVRIVRAGQGSLN